MNQKALAIALILMTTIAASLSRPARAIPLRDSSLFNFKYEMNALPTADDQGGAAGADWTTGSNGQSGGPPSAGGGIMNMNFTDATQYFEFNNGDTGLLDWSTGYTMEIRAKLLTTPAKWNFSIIALPGLGHNDSLPFLHVGKSTMNWGEGGAGDFQIDGSANDDGLFHTFRIAAEPSADIFHIYRDGVEIGLGPLPGARHDLGGLGLRKIAFGDEGDVWQGSTDVDYFRFDTTGAYAPTPVPEPTTLALTLAGLLGLAGMMWRKRL